MKNYIYSLIAATGLILSACQNEAPPAEVQATQVQTEPVAPREPDVAKITVKFISKWDTDQDGMLSKDEYLKITTTSQHAKEMATPESAEKHLKDVSLGFDNIDENKDGKLSRAEIAQTISTKGYPISVIDR